MPAVAPQIVRANEGTVFMEGAEFARKYLATDKIMFGTSTLQPGTRGNIDPGHPDSHEVFFVIRGHVLILGDGDTHHELWMGDAMLIPEGMPHTLINVGDEEAVISWSCAPTP